MSVNLRKTFPASPKFFNRELSWLAFNEQVLDQAFSPQYPLLERTRFILLSVRISINFMKYGWPDSCKKWMRELPDPAWMGVLLKALLDEVRQRAQAMSQREYACWRDSLQPALAKSGVKCKSIDQLNQTEFTWLRAYFRREVFPVLTPLAIDPTHPFPLILNKSLNLFFHCGNLRRKKAKPLRAVVQVPRILPRLVRLNRWREG